MPDPDDFGNFDRAGKKWFDEYERSLRQRFDDYRRRAHARRKKLVGLYGAGYFWGDARIDGVFSSVEHILFGLGHTVMTYDRIHHPELVSFQVERLAEDESGGTLSRFLELCVSYLDNVIFYENYGQTSPTEFEICRRYGKPSLGFVIQSREKEFIEPPATSREFFSQKGNALVVVMSLDELRDKLDLFLNR